PPAQRYALSLHALFRSFPQRFDVDGRAGRFGDLSAAPALHELLKQESNEDVGGLASFGHAAKLPGELRHPGLEELQLIDRLSERSEEHTSELQSRENLV